MQCTVINNSITKFLPMLTLFENITGKLTDYEKDSIVPMLIQTIGSKTDKKMAVTNSHLVSWLGACRIETSQVRVRMMINHIRNNNLLPCLMGSAKGYYVTDNPAVVDDQIESIMGRVRSMLNVVESLKAQKINLVNKTA